MHTLLTWGRSQSYSFKATTPGRRGLTALHLAALIKDQGAIAGMITGGWWVGVCRGLVRAGQGGGEHLEEVLFLEVLSGAAGWGTERDGGGDACCRRQAGGRRW